MPVIWAKFGTQEQSEQAKARLEHAGFERSQIDRIQGADGRWSMGTYADESEAGRVRAIMLDPHAPTGSLRNSLLVGGFAALAGMVLGYLARRSLPATSRRQTLASRR